MAIEFWVATDGSDAHPGTQGRPFASLERAREALRALPERGGATVWLRGGVYRRTKTFVLTAEDSGREGAPVSYRAWPGEEPRLVGGVEVGDFQPVTDPAILERLHEHARGRVLQADLRAAGVADLGQLRTRGFGRGTRPAALELFFQGKPMTLARFPGTGFLPILGAPGGSEWETAYPLEAGFYFHSQELSRWQSAPDPWIHGYWAYDWADSHERVESIDPESGLIKTREPYGVYGFRPGQRFYFENLLEELTQENEYYVDRASGLLYFYPPAEITPGSCWVSVLEDPLVRLEDASDVTLQGLTLECSRGNGIEIADGERVLVAGCTLRNLGNSGVLIQSGTGHGVVGCDLHELGDGGISITSGDRATLTPGVSYADNNHLHHLGRWDRCYVSTAITLAGVGLRASHNLIHDLPHTAIIIGGNDHLVEYNEIHHVCLETGDVGAFYMGRDYTARGNVVRYNFFHDLGGFQFYCMGIYLDDCTSGVEVFGKVLYRAGSAVHLGGGRDVSIVNNIMVDCRPAIHVDARGADPYAVWHDMVYDFMPKRVAELHAFEAPFSERYPELLSLQPYYAPGAAQNGIPPENDLIAHNIAVGQWLDLSGYTPWGGSVEIRDNLVDEDPLFLAPERLDFRLCEDSPAYRVGFQPIPFEEIGLCADAYRPVSNLTGGRTA